MSARVGTGKRGAAKQDIDTVVQRIDPGPLPQQLNHPFGAVVGQDAGAAEFHQSLAAIGSFQGSEIELAFGIKAASITRLVIEKQPVGANDISFAHRSVDNE